MRESGSQRAVITVGASKALRNGVDGMSTSSFDSGSRTNGLMTAPTLTNGTNPGMMMADEIGALRAQEYMLLAALLRRPMTSHLLDQLGSITGDASPLGIAHIALADAAQRTDERAAGREFFNLFIGVGRGELLPYASFYLTGFLNERPLGRVREDLAKLGIERAEGNHDPEDHVSTLLETMAGLASGDIVGDLDAEKAFFERHLKPWVARFFADLGVAPSSEFYKAVAGVGRTFIAIETEAFTMPDSTATTH
jgi:TorA maturation chaperone TorD